MTAMTMMTNMVEIEILRMMVNLSPPDTEKHSQINMNK